MGDLGIGRLGGVPGNLSWYNFFCFDERCGVGDPVWRSFLPVVNKNYLVLCLFLLTYSGGVRLEM